MADPALAHPTALAVKGRAGALLPKIEPLPATRRDAPPKLATSAVAKPARRRRWGLIVSFVMFVLGSIAGAGGYLYGRAVDQFHSTTVFAMRTEEAQTGLDVLSGLTALSGSSSSDTDILNAFLLSQQLVEQVQGRVDLRALWSKPKQDPVFAFDPSGSIEDLTMFWERMVRISYDHRTNLIELKVHAFTPEDAQQIAQAILAEASAMIDRLSAVAQDDAIATSLTNLELAQDRLRAARLDIAELRAQTRVVDPLADLEGDMGVLAALEQDLAAERVRLGMLAQNGATASAADIRMSQAELRVSVLEQQIAQERSNLAARDGQGLSVIVGDFERLALELRFAEEAYVSSAAALDMARADAQRKSRYLAAFVEPTLSERALYPRRAVLLGTVAAVSLLFWALLVMVYFSVRDRRSV